MNPQAEQRKFRQHLVILDCEDLQSQYQDWNLLLAMTKLYIHGTVPCAVKSQEEAQTSWKFDRTFQNVLSMIHSDRQSYNISPCYPLLLDGDCQEKAALLGFVIFCILNALSLCCTHFHQMFA